MTGCESIFITDYSSKHKHSLHNPSIASSMSSSNRVKQAEYALELNSVLRELEIIKSLHQEASRHTYYLKPGINYDGIIKSLEDRDYIVTIQTVRGRECIDISKRQNTDCCRIL